MLLAVAQQEDEVPTVRREAIAALVAVLEDDKRKIEVGCLHMKQMWRCVHGQARSITAASSMHDSER